MYAARREYHEGLTRRRSRDNLIAALGGGALILAVLGGQIAYFTAGPGAPEPTPTETPAPTPAPTDSLSPAPTAPLSPAPTDLPADPTPSPTP